MPHLKPCFCDVAAGRAHTFQCGRIIDDVTPEGQIDYALTNKVPAELRQAIADAKAGKAGAKKILVLMNPPYAEAMSVDNTTAANGKTASAPTWARGCSLPTMPRWPVPLACTRSVLKGSRIWMPPSPPHCKTCRRCWTWW